MAKRKAPARKSKSTPAKPLSAKMRVVLLRGPELFLHASHTRRLVELLRESYGEIEQFRFDGANANLAQILDELRTYGLMQRHKLVILDNADVFLANKKSKGDDDEAGDDSSPNRAAMERYVQSPVEEATLLLRAETWRPGRIDKFIDQVGTIIKCEEMSPAETAKLAVGRAEREYEAQLAPQAATLLVDRVGTNLARVDAELARLSSYVGKGGNITAQVIRDLVEPTREEMAWVIQEAVLTGKPGHALTKLTELIEVSRQPEQLIFWSIADLVRKLYHAAQLTQAGEHASSISRRLRLWGPAQYAVMDAASHIQPADFAQLLHDALSADMGTKTGRCNPRRTLEGLVVRVADTIGS